MIRVAIVDDQPLFASGLAMLIEAQSDMDCVGTATNGLKAIALAETAHPDVVLMDLRMPQMNGLVATERILAAHPTRPHDDYAGPRVVVLTTILKDEAVLQALRVGASAFLTKDVTPEILLATIRGAHAGETVSPTSLEIARTSAPEGTAARPPEVMQSLTPRESSVFRLVAGGLSNAEISKTLFLSDATTKTHVRSILSKLCLRSRVQVVIFAYENGLLASWP